MAAKKKLLEVKDQNINSTFKNYVTDKNMQKYEKCIHEYKKLIKGIKESLSIDSLKEKLDKEYHKLNYFRNSIETDKAVCLTLEYFMDRCNKIIELKSKTPNVLEDKNSIDVYLSNSLYDKLSTMSPIIDSILDGIPKDSDDQKKVRHIKIKHGKTYIFVTKYLDRTIEYHTKMIEANEFLEAVLNESKEKHDLYCLLRGTLESYFNYVYTPSKECEDNDEEPNYSEERLREQIKKFHGKERQLKKLFSEGKKVLEILKKYVLSNEQSSEPSEACNTAEKKSGAAYDSLYM